MHKNRIVESDGFDKAVLNIREECLEIIIGELVFKSLPYKQIPKPSKFVWNEILTENEIGFMPIKTDSQKDLNIY